MDSKLQLHVSMLDMLSRCGIQFERRYGARFGIWHKEEILPPGIALLVGTATHKAVEANLNHKIDTGELLPSEQVAETTRDSFHAAFDRQEVMLDPEEAVNVKKTVGDATDQAVALALLHHAELAPTLQPVAVEKRFVIETNGYPFDLAGQIDIVEAGDGIRDTKTASKSPAEHVARSMQMAMYSLSHQVETGRLPAKVSIDSLVKTKVPKLVTVQAVPEAEWVDPLLKRMHRFMEIIDAAKSGAKVFTPADASHWCCSPRFCGYFATCEFRGGQR